MLPSLEATATQPRILKTLESFCGFVPAPAWGVIGFQERLTATAFPSFPASIPCVPCPLLLRRTTTSLLGTELDRGSCFVFVRNETSVLRSLVPRTGHWEINGPLFKNIRSYTAASAQYRRIHTVRSCERLHIKATKNNRHEDPKSPTSSDFQAVYCISWLWTHIHAVRSGRVSPPRLSAVQIRIQLLSRKDQLSLLSDAEFELPFGPTAARQRWAFGPDQ